MNTNIRRAVLAFCMLASTSTIAQVYSPGFKWDRTSDWTAGVAIGSTLGNPDTDKAGSPVWRYEYTSGGPLGASDAWYLEPKSLMVWDYWNPVGPAPENLWVRADNLEPKINKEGLSHSRSERWESWEYQSLVRWINPVGDGTIIDVDGKLMVEWGGWGVSPDVAVDVIIAFKDSSENILSLLYSNTVGNPNAGAPNPPFSRVLLPVSLQDLRFDEGDSLLFSARAVSAPSELDSWIILYDDVSMSYVGTVTAVPEPETLALLLSGLGVLGFTFRRKVCAPRDGKLV